MFGLGFGEILIILVLALLLLGPQMLPDAAKQLGKSLREFRKATDDLKQQFEGELYADGRQQRKLAETAASDGAPAAAAAAAPAGEPGAAGEAPPATAENVPGLEAALAEVPRPQAGAEAAPAAAGKMS
jgi:sec-independent protein translocase protein TatB